MGTCSNAPSGWCDDTGCAVKGCKLEHRSSKEKLVDDLRAWLSDAADDMKDQHGTSFVSAAGLHSLCTRALALLDGAAHEPVAPSSPPADPDPEPSRADKLRAALKPAGVKVTVLGEANEPAACCDRCERYRDDTGHYPYCPVGEGTQKGCCTCSDRPAQPPPAARRIELLNLLDDRERKHDAFSLAEQSGKYAEELRSFDEAHCAVLDWVTDHADELLPLLRATPPPNCVHPFAKLGIDGDGVMWCVQCLTKPLVIPVPFGETVPPTVPLPMLSDMYKLYDALRQVGELNWPFDKDHHAVLNMIDEKYGRQMGDLLDDDGNPVACRWKPPERLVHPCIGPNCVLCQSESRPIETSEPLCLHGRPYSRGCTDCGRTRAPLSENKGDQS